MLLSSFITLHTLWDHYWSGMVECQLNWTGSNCTSKSFPIQKRSPVPSSLNTWWWFTLCHQTWPDACVPHRDWRGSSSKLSVHALPHECVWGWWVSKALGPSIWEIWSMVFRSSLHFFCERVWKRDIQSQSVPWTNLKKFICFFFPWGIVLRFLPIDTCYPCCAQAEANLPQGDRTSTWHGAALQVAGCRAWSARTWACWTWAGESSKTFITGLAAIFLGIYVRSPIVP